MNGWPLSLSLQELLWLRSHEQKAMEGGKDVIMVAVDGGKRAEKAFERALEIANPSRHSIFIVVAITESVTLSSDVFPY